MTIFLLLFQGESDGSEFDPGKSDVDESVMSTKRVVRRIRRHLSYLDKHWTELNRSMLAYRQQLDRAFQVKKINNAIFWIGKFYSLNLDL